MDQREGIITLHGNPLTLVGLEVRPGQKAPDFQVLDNDLNPVQLSSYDGKIRVIASVPSLDTPVCDVQTRKFNEAAGNVSADTVVLTISMDLPFAQKRWCGAAGVEHVTTLSDHRDADFGQKYGVLIKELRLLARSIFIVDAGGVVRYVQLVNEVGDEPDYDAVLAELKSMA